MQEIKCFTRNEPLKIFCGTCEELICHDCTVRIHRDHDYDLISDCYISQTLSKIRNMSEIS